MFNNYTNPIKFREDIYPILLQNEAENCLGIGIIDTLINMPERYSKFHLAAIKSKKDNSVVGASWITPPHPLGITRLAPENISSVIDFALELSERPSGVVGPSETVELFKELWTRSTGAQEKTHMQQGIYELRYVEAHFNKVLGRMRLATSSDLSLAEKWNLQFSIDCGLGNDKATAKANAEHVIKHKMRYFWEINDRPVAMAGVSGNTPNGIRIGYVYTPPELRGKGYASALVAKLSQAQFDAGKKLCFLYTDLANPTSNAIYQRIGYKKVSESTHYIFEY
ncbi:MAG: GNAT family N-acetyltransferase [Oligoflexales bacterium]|nr:GNAT family N-acetyltransferase [Oligoflexales bacterium]